MLIVYRMNTASRPHQPNHIILDATAVKVLAHPLRVRLLGQLRRYGPATATTVAKALASNTGATSYHLRKLAQVGLVVETPGGRGRERWWRAAHEMHSWLPSKVADDPDARAAASWLTGSHLRFFIEKAELWAGRRDSEAAAWQDEAGASDYLLHLDATQLHNLHQELFAVIERYRVGEPGPEARPLTLFIHAIPDDGDGS
jgi:DNA-binding transcriptional ArsR family regulator